jgi:hypothetical protein
LSGGVIPTSTFCRGLEGRLSSRHDPLARFMTAA